MLRGAQRLAILIFIFSMVCLFSAWCNLLKKNPRTPSPVMNPTTQAVSAAFKLLTIGVQNNCRFCPLTNIK
jgi:hypothetical protein